METASVTTSKSHSSNSEQYEICICRYCCIVVKYGVLKCKYVRRLLFNICHDHIAVENRYRVTGKMGKQLIKIMLIVCVFRSTDAYGFSSVFFATLETLKTISEIRCNAYRRECTRSSFRSKRTIS